MAVKSSDLMVSLLTNLQNIVTGSDDSNPGTGGDDSTFVTWCSPGIVFDPEDLAFGASVADGDNQNESDLLKLQFEFAKLVNYVPTVGPIYDQAGTSLDQAFETTVKQSEVASNPISEEVKAKMEKFRDLLKPVVTDYTDILGKPKTKIEASELMQAYDSAMADYETALQDYTRIRIAAQSGVKGAAKEFASMGSILKKKVNNAYAKWGADGYREEVDEMQAFIAQTTARSLVLWKKGILDNIANSKVTDSISGSDYLWTSFLPGNFMNRSAGWTQISFGSAEYASHDKGSKDAWGASVDVNFGLWNAGGETKGKLETVHGTTDLAEFNISFSLTQVPIVRPWFDPTFLKSRAWRLSPGGVAAVGSATVSTGGVKPTGYLPAYTTTAIFIKDLALTITSADTSFDSSLLTTESKAHFGWGPVKISGNYSNERSDKAIKNRNSGGTIFVDGMQLIGFKCQKVNYVTPNPNADITDWE